jgi:uncharacterized protein (DUF302 family)
VGASQENRRPKFDRNSRYNPMSYYFAKTVTGAGIEEVDARVRAALKEEGFGVLTEIDVAKTMKDKIDADMRPYRILGACNPQLAFEALSAEDKIGTMLPCNVILQETGDGAIEVAAVDPAASMQAVDNPALAEIAGGVRDRLQRVIEAI